jgi:hypothetical protein
MDLLQYQQCKRKHYYGYGSAVYKEEDFEADGQFKKLKAEGSGRIRRNWRSCWTCFKSCN